MNQTAFSAQVIRPCMEKAVWFTRLPAMLLGLQRFQILPILKVPSTAVIDAFTSTDTGTDTWKYYRICCHCQFFHHYFSLIT